MAMASFDSDEGVAALSMALAEAEAEFRATLNESIEDIEKASLYNNHDEQAGGGTLLGSDTGTNNNDYSSFDEDDLSLGDELDNLEGLAMEELANELRALDEMKWNQHTIGPGGTNTNDIGAAPFEGKGRRARARKARIKREIKAREERARTYNGSALKLPTFSSSSSLAKAAASPGSPDKKPLKSLSTSSLGRALAASTSKASGSELAHLETAGGGRKTNSTLSRNCSSASMRSSSSKFDNKRNDHRTGGRGKNGKNSRKQKDDDDKQKFRSNGNAKAPPSLSKPYEGKGRRARARRSRERHEAQQAEALREVARDTSEEALIPASAPAPVQDANRRSSNTS